MVSLAVRGGSAFQTFPRTLLSRFVRPRIGAYGRISLVFRYIGRVSARRPTDFFVVRQRSRQESVPRCRAPFGGALFPGPSGGVCANSPCGLKHAQPFFRLPNPPVGAPEGRGHAGDQRPVLDPISVGARCIRKARSDPAEQRTSRRGSRPQADRGWRVAFFAFFLGEARKKVARRGRVPGRCDAKHGKSVPQGLNPQKVEWNQPPRFAQSVESASLSKPSGPARKSHYTLNAHIA